MVKSRILLKIMQARRAEDEGKRGYKTLERRQGKGVVMLGDVMCLVEITLKYGVFPERR